MSLESELKKNTAALIALADALLLQPQSQPQPQPQSQPQPIGATVDATAKPYTPPPGSVSMPPPVAQVVQAQPAPADADAHKRMVEWARVELGKVQGRLAPTRQLEIIRAHGGNKLSELTTAALPMVVNAIQGEAQASGQVPPQ